MSLKLFISSFLWILSSVALSAPYDLSYGGRLAEASGRPVSGPVNLRITFFRSLSGNDQVAVALPDFQNVLLQEGSFQIALNLSPSDLNLLFNGSDSAFIQIEDLSHGVTYPRQKFLAVPYALKVPVNPSLFTYGSDGLLSLAAAGGSDGKVLKMNASGGIYWGDDLNGGGAGSITSSELQDGAVTTTKIAGNAVTNAHIANGAIASAKINGLGALATQSTVGSMEITDGSVTSADIANGTITDADISATANISYLKISGLGALATKSSVVSSDITDGTIVDADISNSAAITDTKLATITTAGKVANTATTASSVNTSSAIVARDANGDFAARHVSANSVLGLAAPTNDNDAANKAYVDAAGSLTYKRQIFLQSGTWTPPAANTKAFVTVIGGSGSGAAFYGDSPGAGSCIANTAHYVSNNGQTSSFGAVSAAGGYGGGVVNDSAGSDTLGNGFVLSEVAVCSGSTPCLIKGAEFNLPQFNLKFTGGVTAGLNTGSGRMMGFGGGSGFVTTAMGSYSSPVTITVGQGGAVAKCTYSTSLMYRGSAGSSGVVIVEWWE